MNDELYRIATNTSFSEMFTRQFNSPDCSILSGMLSGVGITASYTIQIIIVFSSLYVIKRTVLDAVVGWIKNKMDKKKQ